MKKKYLPMARGIWDDKEIEKLFFRKHIESLVSLATLPARIKAKRENKNGKTQN